MNPPAPNAPLPRPVPGKLVAILSFLALLAIALFTYFAVPQFVAPYFREKPALTSAAFDRIEAALHRYAADHGGALPPPHGIHNYRRLNRNFERARAAGIETFRAAALTTPVEYLTPREWGDPFALPEQFVPPAYAVVDLPAEGERWAVLSSPGPNLQHDVRTDEVRGFESSEELLAYLEEHTWTEERGTRGGYGDLVRVARIPLSGHGPPEQ